MTIISGEISISASSTSKVKTALSLDAIAVMGKSIVALNPTQQIEIYNLAGHNVTQKMEH